MFAHETIKNCISEKIADGAKSFIIYPCGDNGNRTIDVLHIYFSINPQDLVDNKKGSLVMDLGAWYSGYSQEERGNDCEK